MKPRTPLDTLAQMDSLLNNGLSDTNYSATTENDGGTNFGGCPVGKPYPWIYDIPKIFTQNFTSNITPLPPEEVSLKVVFYIFTIVVALVSKHANFQILTEVHIAFVASSLCFLNGYSYARVTIGFRLFVKN